MLIISDMKRTHWLSLAFFWSVLGSGVGQNSVYHWDSDTCQKVFQANEKIEGTGCVAPGSIASVARKCPACAYDYQCESGWCHKDWKLCYDKEVGGCSKWKRAECQSCSSVRGIDLGNCSCANEDFPNNWVECTDGSGGIDTYDLDPGFHYIRQENSDGSLSAADLFASNVQCYHNQHRETAGLLPMKWNTELALFAKQWVNHLKDTNQCKIYHSKDRKDLAGFVTVGENLFRKQIVGNVTANEIPLFGKGATQGWFGEMINYQYAGPEASAGECPYRNIDLKKNPQVLHLTAVMWEKTTDIGCDYSICEPNEKGHSYVAVSCTYGPAGNVKGQAPFNDTIYCNLNNQYEVVKEFGLIPRCDGLTVDCENMDSWTTAPPATVETTEAVNLASDALCMTDKGRTCKFPWTKKGYGTFESCQDAVNRRGKPICFTLEEKWDKCPSDSLDPDCYFELPQNVSL